MTELWPHDIAASSSLIPPIAVLKTAGSELSKKTNGLLRGYVQTHSYNPSADALTHTFYILASALSDYQYKILDVSHKVELYPANVAAIPGVFDGTSSRQANNSTELENVLKEVFASDRITRVVQSLLVQSEAA